MKRSRLIAATWVAVVLAVMLLLNEPLRGMFEGTVLFEWPGYVVFSLLFLLSVAGILVVLRSHTTDPEFRGAISELTRLLALGEAIIMTAAWIFYFMSTY